ncbi:MAG: hypothetical protein EXR69_09795 [Myxococcales bacterium]|nr:hypothetical protein [Myxococcales bacterium]
MSATLSLPGSAPALGLVEETDLFQFFRSRVQEATTHQRACVSEGAQVYLAQLLTEVGHGGEGDDSPGPCRSEETFAELHVKAALAHPGEAVTLLKRLGDWSLLLTGFFREHLARRRLSREYCARMGGGAYHRLERMFPGDDTLAPVFGELAERYDACSEVIAEVRDEAAGRSDADVLRLYEEWLRTGSPRVAERLKELGVVPGRGGKACLA